MTDPREPLPLRYVRAARDHIDHFVKVSGFPTPTPSEAICLLIDNPGYGSAMRMNHDGDTKMMLASVACMAAWRRTQFIYTFDDDLYDALAETDNTPTLDTYMFERLPAKSVWVDVPGRNTTAIVTYDPSVVEGHSVWFTIFDPNSEPDVEFRCFSCILPLELSLGAAIEKSYVHWSVDDRDTMREAIADVAACALYLCSEAPDVAGAMSNLNKRRVRRGELPYGPTLCTAGHRVGAAFRKAKADHAAALERGELGTGGGARIPHYRRAHWHSYWVGARGSDEQHKIIKWLAPVAVNVKPGAPVPAVTHPVRKEPP